MCNRHGIECCLTETCSRLCVPATEWADQDHIRQVELTLSMDLLEELAADQIVSRIDGVRLAAIKVQVLLDHLTPAQRAAIEGVFFDPSGERQSYAIVARKLGVKRETLREHIKKALKTLSCLRTE